MGPPGGSSFNDTGSDVVPSHYGQEGVDQGGQVAVGVGGGEGG